MSDLVKVWDKEGNMFEVSTINASDFIQHLGWTTKNPNPEVKAEIKAVSDEADAEGEDSSDAEADAPKAKRGRPTLKQKAQDEAPTE